MTINKIIQFRELGDLIKNRYNTWYALKKYDIEIDKKISNAVIKELKYLLKYYEDNK